MAGILSSWHDGPTNAAIVDFVGSVSASVPPEERIAVFDAGREFDYTAGAELALERARESGWTVVSMKDDWATVFSEGAPG
jgi:hypothetical protein